METYSDPYANPYTVIFCENMKRLREDYAFTKTKMAQILGVSVATITKIEKGVIPPRLNMDAIDRAAEYFGITPYNLFNHLRD